MAGKAGWGAIPAARTRGDTLEMPLHCDTLVVHCIDYRLQKFLNDWVEKNLPVHSFDRVAIAGGINDVFYVIRQVDVAVQLHNIKRAILINHEDCGVYGEVGNYERHKMDLKEAKRKIESFFPNLDVETYYLYLDGEFEPVSKTNR